MMMIDGMISNEEGCRSLLYIDINNKGERYIEWLNPIYRFLRQNKGPQHTQEWEA